MKLSEQFIKKYSQQCKLPEADLLKVSNLLNGYLNNCITIGSVETLHLANGWKKITIKEG
jgi:hypothetical protein